MFKSFMGQTLRRNLLLAASFLTLTGGGYLLASNQAVSATSSNFVVKIPDIPVLVISLYDSTGSEMDSGDITRLNVTPSMATAGFNSTGMSVKVGTSSTAGYKLNMSVANSGQLVSGTNFIAPLPENPDENNPYSCTAATASDCNFTVNSWGYWMTGQTANTYLPIPTTETNLVNYTAGATDEDTTDFAFGVRANAKQPGGDYETTINFIATANPETTIHSLQYMQDFNVLMPDEYAAVVESMKEDESYELVDSRDNTTYNVAKLADGNVWLLENLRLGAATLKGDLTSSNTNLSTTITKSTFDGWSKTSGFSVYTSPMYNTGSNSETQPLAKGVSGTAQVGVYYNYCAASAKTYCMAEGSGSGDASYDICPAGWMMPKGNTADFSYQALRNAYSDDASFVSALKTPLSGYFYSGSARDRGYGYFWSSTYNDGNNMRDLYVDGSSVYPQSSYNRSYGLSVRCVLKSNENNVVINFNGNGATSGKNRTLGYKAGSGATIPTVDMVGLNRTRYVFLGWNTKVDGSGTNYAAGASVTITAEMNGLTLYAQWQEATLAMQDADSTSLGNLLTNNGDITFLYDSRDDNVYTIGKLNGKYWMLDNLALGGSSAINLTPSDTNITSNYTLPASVDSGFTDDTSGRTVARINADYKDIELEYASGLKNKVGVYYNYCAASAGQICMDSNSGTSATTDICPKGWRLPTGGGSGEFKSLYGQYNNYTTFKTAFHASLSGFFYDSSMIAQGSDGYWWSSTYGSSTNMYYLYLLTSTVFPESGYGRRYGYSVRCVYGD